MWSLVNVLQKGLKISDLTKTDVFKRNLSYISGKLG